MGDCVSRTGHPGEDFVWEVLRTIKLKDISYEDIKKIVFKTQKEGNYTVDTGFPISKDEALEISSNFYETDPKRNYYMPYHKLLFNYLIEAEYKNSQLKKINSFNLIFLVFGFLKAPEKPNYDEIRKERIENFISVLKNIEEKETIFNYIVFKNKMKKYMTLSTVSVTQAVLTESINQNILLKTQENLKDLMEKVYTQKFIEDFLTAKLRHFESEIKLKQKLNEYEIINAEMEQIFDDSMSTSYFYVFDLRNDFVQIYSLT